MYKLALWLLLICSHLHEFAFAAAISGGGTGEQPRSQRPTNGPMPNLVSWDAHSYYVRGERLMLLSGEFHPFRLPSPGLWLDVFQKVKGLGFNTVSFYTDWALLEGEPGHFRADGIFDIRPFFDAARTAGIYLIARPGPYINAESSGGGLPGWIQRVPSEARTTSMEYMQKTQIYVSNMSAIIAEGQISRDGPVILFQPENEYSISNTVASLKALGAWYGGTPLQEPQIDAISSDLDPEYMEQVEHQYRQANIEVPFIANDAVPAGHWAPGTGVGAVDIYGQDFYPFGYGAPCNNPSYWPPSGLPDQAISWTLHLELSPSSPFTLSEYQGGNPDFWGGTGIEQCVGYFNEEFARLIYKHSWGNGVKLMNLYMMYGGTNWGNLGYPDSYTSYDLAAPISEDRLVSREKYSELKLQGNFFKVSPAYLTSIPQPPTNFSFSDNSDITITQLAGNSTNFYVARQSNYSSLDSTSYRLRVATSVGHLIIPQLGGTLALHGRDSKIHVTDYDVGDIRMLYSSAEIFTWTMSGPRTVLVLYGGEGETHEFAIPISAVAARTIEGTTVEFSQRDLHTVVRWSVAPDRRIVQFGDDLEVHLLWRNQAYNYWTLDMTKESCYLGSSVLVQAGYLMRNASISRDELHLYGDVNATTTVEVISAPYHCSGVFFNGRRMQQNERRGHWTSTITFDPPDLQLPDLQQLQWNSIDSLPEIRASYDDYAWTSCDLLKTPNSAYNQSTPTSLFAGDYGYHAGSLLYRGHFTAKTEQTTLTLATEGGNAYGHSVWLNSTFLGSWPGNGTAHGCTQSFTLSILEPDAPYVLTVLIDQTGLGMMTFIGNEVTGPGAAFKTPRGILDFEIAGHKKADVQ